MSEQYIQSQYLVNQITNDFFKDRDSPIIVKRVQEDDYTINNRYSDTESDDDSNEDDQEEHYSYLDENKEDLSTIFDLCDNETNILKKYSVYICGYQVQVSDKIPYVQYLLVQEGDRHEFPFFSFQCSTNIPSSNDDESTTKQVFFQNECMKHLLKFIEPLEGNNDEPTPSFPQYQGFIQHKVQEDSIYVFMNIDNFQLKKGIFGVMDEIVNQHSILNRTIAPHVYQLFYEYPSLIHIKNKWGNRVEFPTVLYRCTYENGNYQNIQSEDDDTMSIIDDRIEHPILGNSFIFSCEPIDESNATTLKRYIGFLEDPLYLMKPLDFFDDSESFTLGSVIPSIVDYTREMTKNTSEEEDDREEEKDEEEEDDDDEEDEEEDDEEEDDDEEEKDEEEEDDDEEDEEEDDDEEDEEEDDDEEEEEDEEEDIILTKEEEKEQLLENLKKNYSCIYFPIQQDSSIIHAWSIKNSSHFTEI